MGVSKWRHKPSRRGAEPPTAREIRVARSRIFWTVFFVVAALYWVVYRLRTQRSLPFVGGMLPRSFNNVLANLTETAFGSPLVAAAATD